MRLRVACAAVLLVAQGVVASPPSVRLEELTSNELREAVAAGMTTVLVPIGGTEQNGPQMTLGKHNARAAALAGRIAESLGNALVAPVIAYVPEGSIDPPSGHMKFPGTLSIPADAFEKTLEGAARSLRHAGFRDIVFLGDHGGYRASLDKVAARLDREWRPTPVRVHALPEYYREMPHAGRGDTSLALALEGPAVRADLIGPQAPRQGAAEDPTGASREHGVEMARAIVERSVAAIKKATARR